MSSGGLGFALWRNRTERVPGPTFQPADTGTSSSSPDTPEWPSRTAGRCTWWLLDKLTVEGHQPAAAHSHWCDRVPPKSSSVVQSRVALGASRLTSRIALLCQRLEPVRQVAKEPRSRIVVSPSSLTSAGCLGWRRGVCRRRASLRLFPSENRSARMMEVANRICDRGAVHRYSYERTASTVRRPRDRIATGLGPAPVRSLARKCCRQSCDQLAAARR